MRSYALCALLFASLSLCAEAQTPPTSSQAGAPPASPPTQIAKPDPPSPEEYCKIGGDHDTEDKCLKYYGSQSTYYSRSGTLNGDSQQHGPVSSLYGIYLHLGTAPAQTALDSQASLLLSTLTNALRDKGYLVRGVDLQFDPNGPGVDFFFSSDAPVAADVAATVNALIPKGSSQIVPRYQSVKNPQGYLGLWIYGNRK